MRWLALLVLCAGCGARPRAPDETPISRALRTLRFLPECGAAWHVTDRPILELDEPAKAPTIPARARRPAKKGDLLYTFGPTDARWMERYLKTMRREWTLRTYRVAADPISDGDGLSGVIVVEGEAFRGQSGAPVVTADGEVAGTLYASTRTHAFIIPVEPYVDELLQAAGQAP